MKTALITGAAGFIGYHLSRRLLAQGWRVTGIDNLTPYYDVALKRARQERLCADPNFSILNAAVESPGTLHEMFDALRPELVVHLAAQAGVRHSIDAPRDYVAANLVGTVELLEAARAFPPAHLLLASTSSVYGANTEMPYREGDRADWPVSFYAATKKATEAMAHSYAHLYGLPTTMFRFFTVYGPWGRPDMAHFKFTRAILEGTPIEIYNHGRMQRDFTAVDDLVAALVALIDKRPDPQAPVAGDSVSPTAPYRVVNIGNGRPESLLDFVAAIEAACGREAQKTFLGMQPGDVPATWADTTLLETLTGHRPATPLREGMRDFVDWYRDYYGV